MSRSLTALFVALGCLLVPLGASAEGSSVLQKHSSPLQVTAFAAFSAASGVTSSYELVLFNSSPSAIKNVRVTDLMPKGVVALSGKPAFKLVSGKPTWTVKSVPYHRNVILRLKVQYPAKLSGKLSCHRGRAHVLGTSITVTSKPFCSRVVSGG